MARRQQHYNSKTFDPRMVPEILAGYYWEAASATGLGTAGFKIPEGNGNTAFDLVQATVASQPTALTESGGAQFRLRKQGDANPTILSTSGDVTAGWTGSTYIAGWWRLPDASGAISGTGNLFAHRKTGAARLNITIVTTGGGRENIQISTDGTTIVTHGFANVLEGSAWHWIEVVYDTSVASPDRLAFYSDLVVQTRALAGSIPATVANVAAPITVGYSAITGFANQDNTDWAAAYYGNGIPSLPSRDRLRRRLAPLALMP